MTGELICLYYLGGIDVSLLLVKQSTAERPFFMHANTAGETRLALHILSSHERESINVIMTIIMPTPLTESMV